MKRPLFFLLLLSMAVAAFAGWASAGPSASTPAEDLARLSDLAAEIIHSEKQLVVVTVRGHGKDDAVRQLMGEMQKYGGQATIMEMDGQSDFTLRYTANGTYAEQDAAAWMDAAAKQLIANRLFGSWNINIQGWLAAGSPVSSVWEYTERSAKAKPVESYEDASTYSVSYDSDLFQSSINSGGQSISLQVAAHRSTQTKEWRVSLGTPVILIEY